MKPLFTIHAGEYLVGEHIEKNFPQWRVWLPSKDTGIDLLITDSRHRKAVALQVKFSKDYSRNLQSSLVRDNLLAGGWWIHDLRKIRKSEADFWVFVLPSFLEKEISYVIISPSELLRRLARLHGDQNSKHHSYLQVTKSQRCWEARGLKKPDHELMAKDEFHEKDRDFTTYLNAWHQVEACHK